MGIPDKGSSGSISLVTSVFRQKELVGIRTYGN